MPTLFLKLAAAAALNLVVAVAAHAQLTTAFSYQGVLEAGEAPANGDYDFSVGLWNAESAGEELASAEFPATPVVDGVFTLEIEFPADRFAGPEARWLRISVRETGSGLPATPLSPRQRLTVAPFSVRSLTSDSAVDAEALGGAAASQYVLTTDPRLTDAREPLPGSGDYIQNGTSTQPGASFAIDGTGAAAVFDAATHFSVAGEPVFTAFSTGVSAGIQAGTNLAQQNTYFGYAAGEDSANSNNTFVGYRAGRFASNATLGSNTALGSSAGLSMEGSFNTFVGIGSGYQVQGNFNTFAGKDAGANLTGDENAIFGSGAGVASNQQPGDLAVRNAFFGTDSGSGITTGIHNSFFGTYSGNVNSSGSFNTLLGASANVADGDLDYATAIGAGAVVAVSNTIALGRADGSDTVRVPGDLVLGGHIALDNADGLNNSFFGAAAGATNQTGDNNTLLGAGADVAEDGFSFATAIGAGAVVSGSNTMVLGRPDGSDTVNVPGDLVVGGSLVGGLPSDSSAYIQNRSSVETAQAANFNINGTGTALLLNARGAFLLDGFPVLRSEQAENNLSVGAGTGLFGTFNTMVGTFAGAGQVDGVLNAYFGTNAGASSTGGDGNVFVGSESGRFNSGSDNAYLGSRAGLNLNAGGENTLVGHDSGSGTNSGSNLTALGAEADFASNGLTFATAVGSGAIADSSNTVVLGRAADRVQAPGGVTIGATTVQYSDDLNINDASGNASIFLSGDGQTKGVNIAVDSTTGADATMFIAQYDGTTFQDRLWMNEFGVFSIGTLGLAGSTPICRNASQQFATCSSSMRYKDDVETFDEGMEVVARLRPVTFKWKETETPDLGLVAEEVARIDPLLVTYNEAGQVEGVKYDRIGVVLVNVVQAQQARLQSQTEEIESLRDRLARLEALLAPGLAER